MKTAELTGAALDWAVAKCEGYQQNLVPTIIGGKLINHTLVGKNYSTNWAQGGPIIEREWLDVTPWPNESDEDLRWQCAQHDNIDCVAFGATLLIAAMRCYVASKLGDEVDIPEELT